MARTEIVNGGRESKRLISSDDAAHMVGVQPLVFGEFEDEPIGRKARFERRFHRQLDAGKGRVDGVGHEVDGKLGLRIQQTGSHRFPDRVDPTGLIERIPIVFGHAPQDFTCAFSIRPSNERLEGVGTARGQIDDRLESRSDVEAEAFAIPASAAFHNHKEPF